jgi:hypothetical protein
MLKKSIFSGTYPQQALNLISIVLLLFLLQGCTTYVGSSFEAKSYTEHQWSKIQHYPTPRYFVFIPEQNPTVMPLRLLAEEDLKMALERQGFEKTSTEDQQKPQFWVSYSFLETAFELPVRRHYHNLMYPSFDYHLSSDRSGALFAALAISALAAQPHYRIERQTGYTQSFKMNIYNAPPEQATPENIVYQISVLSETQEPSLEKNLPWLILAAFENFPAPNATPQTIRIPYVSTRYYAKQN